MGLGACSSVSLAQAREQRDRWRKVRQAGHNPIGVRQSGNQDKSTPSFGECADALIEAKSSQWRNDKHRGQWHVTLETYARPLWGLPVDQVGTEAVLAVLRPIWQTRPETASRLRGRIEAVLDYAKAHGWRCGENPAAWKGHLALILPKRQSVARGHHAALAYDGMPEFIGHLRERQSGSVAAMALEFTILTAARSGEVLGARWDEIDMAAKVWTIPASRMKAGRPHRVPLTTRALTIIEGLAKVRMGEFIFPGQRPGKPLSGPVLTIVLRRMKIEDATVHGFRSSFRDWAGNETFFPREIAESLAHVIGDKAEQAYRRGDALEKRRALMEAWSTYIEPKPANVISLCPRGAA